MPERRGHSTFAEFFGTDKVAVTIVSGRSLDGVPIAPRSFDRFSRVTKEIIDARVWGGIHFRTADVQGTVIGKKVAHWLQEALLPARALTDRREPGRPAGTARLGSRAQAPPRRPIGKA